VENTLLDKYGADTTRLFNLFAAPPEKGLEWSEQGVEGSYRFLNRIWRLVAGYIDKVDEVAPYNGDLNDLNGWSKKIHQKTHATIKRVSHDIEERFHFNTAISAVMELVNAMYAIEIKADQKLSAVECGVIRFALEAITLLLAPIVPHITEEIWASLGHTKSVLETSWPVYREDVLVKDEVLIVVQVNGKLRSRFSVPVDMDKAALEAKALADERVKAFTDGKKVRKVIVVPKKLVNIVV